MESAFTERERNREKYLIDQRTGRLWLFQAVLDRSLFISSLCDDRSIRKLYVYRERIERTEEAVEKPRTFAKPNSNSFITSLRVVNEWKM